MSINNKATITTTELVTVHIEGFEPIKDMRKVSEWNGMWELREIRQGVQGKVILMVDHGGFNASFAAVLGSVFGKAEPAEVVVVAVSPSLLIRKEPG